MVLDRPSSARPLRRSLPRARLHPNYVNNLFRRYFFDDIIPAYALASCPGDVKILTQPFLCLDYHVNRMQAPSQCDTIPSFFYWQRSFQDTAASNLRLAIAVQTQPTLDDLEPPERRIYMYLIVHNVNRLT
jgi:hypothetical protein